MNPIDQVVSLFKSGYKTSEFYVVLLAGVWNAILGAWHSGQSWHSQISGLAVAGVAAVYALARAGVKSSRVSALALITSAVNGAASTVDAGNTTPAAPVDPAAVSTTATVGAVVNPNK